MAVTGATLHYTSIIHHWLKVGMQQLQVEETMSTLSYAMRAKNIQNRPAVQYDPREAQVTMLRREIELLRQENGYLREQLAHDRGMSMAGVCKHNVCAI